MKPETVVWEDGTNVYLAAPLAPMEEPSKERLEEFAFASLVSQAREQAPNPHLGWFGGHYVEADNPNANGAMWTAGELAIKQLTPMFMPVTVMHDPRTAVGLIADASLKTPDTDGVERAKIETALGIWKHRFPEAHEEAMHNYEAGTLMQSMECFAPDYSCSACGMTYHKLPGGAEQDQWCEHLQAANPSGGYLGKQEKASAGETATAVRILRNVCFTGTGLIFGSRGAKGADGEAFLESVAGREEVAEFHQRSHRDQKRNTRKRTPKRNMDPIELSRTEYDSLLQAKRERDEFAQRPTQDDLDSEKQRADKAESDLETAKAEKKTAEEKAESLQTKVDEAAEAKRGLDMKAERWDKLGDGFKAKLGEKTKTNLQEDAAKLSDEDWTARLEEVAELVGVKADEAAEESADEGDDLFTKEEVASTGAASTKNDTEPDEAARTSVVGGLFENAVGADSTKSD